MNTSTFQKIIVYIFLTTGSSSLLSSNIMMRNHYENAYLIPICLLPIILFGVIFINNNLNNIKPILNKRLLKLFGILYLIISTFILVLSYLKITNNYFYFLTPPLLILILILLLSLFISNYGLSNIFNFSFIISIFIFLLILLTLISTKYNKSLNHIIEPNINNLHLIINYLFVYLDVIFISLFNPCIKTTKKNYITITLFSILVNSLLIFQNYILFNSEFFLSNKFPYISKYFTFSFNFLFEHIDLLYLVFITFYIIIRISINTEIFRLICKFKRDNCKIYIFAIVILLLSLLSSLFSINLQVINYIMLLTSFILILFLIIYKIQSRRVSNETT